MHLVQANFPETVLSRYLSYWLTDIPGTFSTRLVLITDLEEGRSTYLYIALLKYTFKKNLLSPFTWKQRACTRAVISQLNIRKHNGRLTSLPYIPPKSSESKNCLTGLL